MRPFCFLYHSKTEKNGGHFVQFLNGSSLDRFICMLTLQSELLPYVFCWSLGVYLRP